MPRPRVHDEVLRQRLLALAGEKLSEKGPEGVSLRALAQEAGTTTRAIYSLFGGREQLLRAVFDEAFARFGAHLAEVAGTGDPREDILRLGRAYRASALDDPHFYVVMFGSTPSGVKPGQRSQQRAADTFEPLRRSVERGMRQGVLRQDDPLRVATALWSAVHGLVSLELGGHLAVELGDPAEFFEASMRAALTGWEAD
ncbi:MULTISPECIES: TetR/AcrR family transcriptional regulator [unclassified Actinopolyspora]|uniref:TetR/AcrR family transcriptional regulator n=1 Tax=unclassified Actinopolyspora TaxID=2639451 RepID=UPI0013F5EDD9|nr:MULTISPECIES: TetR/AcrR family transcriptional regulator [unclassified Actinopolyspora]NHD18318.1 TetR/AcrR family transcriptional regulator [Actinopolyspora sp. BKK2]NHE77003.1 TetR/AcrR family transcriptional regulator [Actinopolyspora sp. BKK1]